GDHMATWVEDITQALINLGGQAHRKQILEEIKLIRKEPLPERLAEVIQRTIQDHSSDSTGFRGNDLFKKIGNGVWALRDQVEEGSLHVVPATHNLSSSKRRGELVPTWVEDIIQALKNLGSQATLNQIYQEVRRIRQEPLPKMWQHIIQDTIYQHSSDTQKFQGNDLFRKVDKGVWSIRKQTAVAQSTHPVTMQKDTIPHNYLPPESFEEIANILRTIKQYRDYQNPDSTSWKEYVDEFFHILGFSTQENNPRLMTLHVIGSNHTPRAIVGFVHPGENFEEMVPGLSWESYLFFAANYYQIDWGILTDGLQLKVVHYQAHEIKQPICWPDLDGIVCHEKLDTFCTIYKVFSFIKGNAGKSQGKQQKIPHGHNGEELAERHILRLEFWGQLLDKAKTKTKLHAKVSPGIENWVSAGAGKSGLGFNYVVRMDDAQVELYIDRGEADWNKRVFNTFLQHKTEIEDIFSGPLDWQLLPDKRASRIRFVVSSYGLKDQDHWDELQELLVGLIIRLEKAFRPFINKI
ncbi:MAG: DUF4268 domain-containing protein, partial [Bellilinea sp.]